MRLLMFCTRYLDQYLFHEGFFMRVYLLFSTLAMVVLLGYDKW